MSFTAISGELPPFLADERPAGAVSDYEYQRENKAGFEPAHRLAPARSQQHGARGPALLGAHTREDDGVMGRLEVPWFSPRAGAAPLSADCSLIVPVLRRGAAAGEAFSGRPRGVRVHRGLRTRIGAALGRLWTPGRGWLGTKKPIWTSSESRAAPPARAVVLRASSAISREDG